MTPSLSPPVTALKTPDLFSHGNTKLSDGKRSIYGFGLPSRHTCPARTPTCTRLCYSYRLEQYRKHVGARHRANLVAAKRSDFAAVASAEIAAKNIRILRVHVGGELFSVDYAEKWLTVFKACPDTKFFLWTRVWRLPRFRGVLRAMARLTNVRLWYSCDKDTGVPTRRDTPKRVKLAYMQIAEDDLPLRGDLVFRVHHLRKKPAKTVPAVRPGERSVPICPTETALPGHETVTCSSCKKCWRSLPHDTPTGKRIPLAIAV